MIQQNATQPVAGTATQPVEAPVAGPEVLLTSTGVQSDSDGDLHSEPGSPVYDNFQDSSPKISPEMRQLIRNSLEETSYRETIGGVRSLIGWYQIPEFDRVSSADDNHFAGSQVQPTRKVKLPVDDWLCRKMGKLNLTIAEGYPSRNTETAGFLRHQFVKPPRLSRWYNMHVDKKDFDRSVVCSWSPEPAKQNSTFSRVARCSLPAAPPSRALG